MNNCENLRIYDINDPVGSVTYSLKVVYQKNSAELNLQQKEKLAELLTKYQDVFDDGTVTGSCNLVEHDIKLGQNNLIEQNPRWVPLHMQYKIDKLISEMQAQGVIEESSSSWCLPVIF